MWHPVGELPAAVYWRRRFGVLVALLAVLGGLAWLTVALLPGGGGSGTASGSSPTEEVPTPALERVVPPVAGVRTPTPPAIAAAGRTATATPAAAGPCTDEMVALTVRAPAVVDIGTRPTIELVVQNTSAAPCVRDLDKALQEIVLLDAGGTRVWGSNDCLSGAGPDRRTLAPGQSVAFPLVWSGRTSEPTCTEVRTDPAPGAYVLRGRLDTKTSPNTPITIR